MQPIDEEMLKLMQMDPDEIIRPYNTRNYKPRNDYHMLFGGGPKVEKADFSKYKF